MTELEVAGRNGFAIVPVSPRVSEVVRLELVRLSAASYFTGTIAMRGTPQECRDYVAEQVGKRVKADRRRETVPPEEMGEDW